MSSIGLGPSSVRIKVPSATQLFPPARSRSTSSGVCAPKSLACEPLGHRITVPPGACTSLAEGSAFRIPPGPSYIEVTPSPRVGATMAIQCGTGPGRHGGPATCSRTYSEQAFDLPAPRPAMMSHPYQFPGGGTWWGSGRHRTGAAIRAASSAAAARLTSMASGCITPRRPFPAGRPSSSPCDARSRTCGAGGRSAPRQPRSRE